MKPTAPFGVSRWERLRSIDPRVGDTLLGVAAFSIALLGALSSAHDAGPAPDATAVALLALATLPLILRRRAPLVVLTVIGAAGVLYSLGNEGADLVAPLAIGAYTAAARLDRRTVTAFVVPIAGVASLALSTTDERDNWIEVLLAMILVPGVPMLLGRISFNRRRRIERDHVLAAREAVATERARIARELHDVVAHSMSVMVVQAGAARAVLEGDPRQAAAALGRIEETGRTGMAEMRRLLGILKADGDDTGLEPQPGLTVLDGLLDRVRSAGLPVEVMVHGEARTLPPGVDLTAYRLVQEALTNTLKHAGPASARVVIRYADRSIELEVADDGRGPPPENGASGGHGLVGMRERVALFGGTLETGERPGGGFRVIARIPVGEAPGAAS